MQLITINPVEKDYDPSFGQKLLRELEQSILREEDPVQRTLGMYELRNPSVGPFERVENRATRIGDLGLFGYKAKIVQDRVGTDFETNQPTYKAREIILE
jgi:hypothetical protein